MRWDGKKYERIVSSNYNCWKCEIEAACGMDHKLASGRTINKHCIKKDNKKGNTGYYKEVV